MPPRSTARTPASGAGYRGSNPWGAAKLSSHSNDILQSTTRSRDRAGVFGPFMVQQRRAAKTPASPLVPRICDRRAKRHTPVLPSGTAARRNVVRNPSRSTWTACSFSPVWLQYMACNTAREFRHSDHHHRSHRRSYRKDLDLHTGRNGEQHHYLYRGVAGGEEKFRLRARALWGALPYLRVRRVHHRRNAERPKSVQLFVAHLLVDPGTSPAPPGPNTSRIWCLSMRTIYFLDRNFLRAP